MVVKTAIILAGGLGTRLRSVVHDVPKPMAPISQQPFLAYQMSYWIKQGIEHFILSVGYKHEVIQDYFGTHYQGVPISYSVEPVPLGTGGGFILAVQAYQLTTPFLLLNGDTYFEVDLQQLDHFACQNDVDWAFSLFSTQDTIRYLGVGLDSTQRIIRFKEEALLGQSMWVNGGVYWIHPRVLVSIQPPEQVAFHQSMLPKCSLEDDILPQLLTQERRLYGLPFATDFIDIGVPSDYFRSEALLTASKGI